MITWVEQPMEEAPLTLWGRAAAVVVLALAAFDLFGRHTAPWTAVWLAGLAVAVLLQSGLPRRSVVAQPNPSTITEKPSGRR
jgi:hypothetical protein